MWFISMLLGNLLLNLVGLNGDSIMEMILKGIYGHNLQELIPKKRER